MEALAQHLQQVHLDGPGSAGGAGGAGGGGKKDDFKMTKDEADRLRQALEKKEFREMLMEYAAELEDPKYKAEQDAYLRQVEGEGRAKEVYGEDVELVVPKAGFCVETTVGKTKKDAKRSKGGTVLYLNVVQSEAIKEADHPQSGQNWSVPYALNVLNVMDAESDKGPRQCVDFAVHPGTLKHCEKSSKVRDFMVELALDAVEERDKVVCSRSFEPVHEKKYVGLTDTPQVITTRRKKGEAPSGDGQSRVPPVSAKVRSDVNAGSGTAGSGKKGSDGGSFKVPGFSFDRKKGSSAREEELARRAARKAEEAAAEREGREIAPEVELVHQGTTDVQDTWRDGELDHASASGRPKALVVRVKLPRCGGTIKGVDLDINERVVSLHAPGKYKLDFELPYEVDDSKGQAKFDKSKDLLTITLPVVPPPRAERLRRGGEPSLVQEMDDVVDDGDKQEVESAGMDEEKVEEKEEEEAREAASEAKATSTTSKAPVNADFSAWLKKGSETYVDPRKVQEEKDRKEAEGAKKNRAADPAERKAAEMAVEAAPIDLPSELTGPFLACRAFSGARKGYVFKTGSEGLGYYLDEVPGAALPPAPPAVEVAAEVTRAAEAAAKSATPAPTAFQSLEPKLSGDMDFDLD